MSRRIVRARRLAHMATDEDISKLFSELDPEQRGYVTLEDMETVRPRWAGYWEILGVLCMSGMFLCVLGAFTVRRVGCIWVVIPYARRPGDRPPAAGRGDDGSTLAGR